MKKSTNIELMALRLKNIDERLTRIELLESKRKDREEREATIALRQGYIDSKFRAMTDLKTLMVEEREQARRNYLEGQR